MRVLVHVRLAHAFPPVDTIMFIFTYFIFTSGRVPTLCSQPDISSDEREIIISDGVTVSRVGNLSSYGCLGDRPNIVLPLTFSNFN
jgi:hypothetical protein